MIAENSPTYKLCFKHIHKLSWKKPASHYPCLLKPQIKYEAYARVFSFQVFTNYSHSPTSRSDDKRGWRPVIYSFSKSVHHPLICVKWSLLSEDSPLSFQFQIFRFTDNSGMSRGRGFSVRTYLLMLCHPLDEFSLFTWGTTTLGMISSARDLKISNENDVTKTIRWFLYETGYIWWKMGMCRRNCGREAKLRLMTYALIEFREDACWGGRTM